MCIKVKNRDQHSAGFLLHRVRWVTRQSCVTQMIHSLGKHLHTVALLIGQLTKWCRKWFASRNPSGICIWKKTSQRVSVCCGMNHCILPLGVVPPFESKHGFQIMAAVSPDVTSCVQKGSHCLNLLNQKDMKLVSKWLLWGAAEHVSHRKEMNNGCRILIMKWEVCSWPKKDQQSLQGACFLWKKINSPEALRKKSAHISALSAFTYLIAKSADLAVGCISVLKFCYFYF